MDNFLSPRKKATVMNMTSDETIGKMALKVSRMLPTPSALKVNERCLENSLAQIPNARPSEPVVRSLATLESN